MTQLVIRKQRLQCQYFAEHLSPDIHLDMILIPAGQFMMGSPENELERQDPEGPQHQVTVPQFFMGRYPVTQAQWQVVAGFTQVNRPLKDNPSNFKGEHRPVEQVSWQDAVEFCDRLALHTGRPHRLPSEAEWEYACLAGTTTPFYFGHSISPELANYDGNYTYGDGPQGEYRGETTPVDHFDVANGFGLSDMHGNVWEWCLDHWHDNYDGAPIDGSAWRDSDENDNRSHVCRGGSWFHYPWYCRSATRGLNGTLLSDTGFRVACSAPRT